MDVSKIVSENARNQQSTDEHFLDKDPGSHLKLGPHLQIRKFSCFGFLSTALNTVTYNLESCIRLKTHRLFQVDIDRREQCCVANYEQVVNHVVPTCYS
jgi:hypothetical protein